MAWLGDKISECGPVERSTARCVPGRSTIPTLGARAALNRACYSVREPGFGEYGSGHAAVLVDQPAEHIDPFDARPDQWTSRRLSARRSVPAPAARCRDVVGRCC